MKKLLALLLSAGLLGLTTGCPGTTTKPVGGTLPTGGVRTMPTGTSSGAGKSTVPTGKAAVPADKDKTDKTDKTDKNKGSGTGTDKTGTGTDKNKTGTDKTGTDKTGTDKSKTDKNKEKP